MEAAEKLARRIDARDYVAASMTRDQAIEYANAVARLKPLNVTVDAATVTVAACLKVVGELSNLHAAAKFYAARHKQTTRKPVAEVVAELLKIKSARGASERYMQDLTGRLERFAGDCHKDACNVTTTDIQDWLDGLKLAPQSYRNFRTVLHTLFKFAVARSYVTWLAPYAERHGKVWPGNSIVFYKRQEAVAAATAVEADAENNIAAQPPVKWKANALRYSYASCRFALTNDAGPRGR